MLGACDQPCCPGQGRACRGCEGRALPEVTEHSAAPPSHPGASPTPSASPAHPAARAQPRELRLPSQAPTPPGNVLPSAGHMRHEPVHDRDSGGQVMPLPQ